MGTGSPRTLVRSVITLAAAALLHFVVSVTAVAASSGGGTFPMLLAR